MSKVRLLMWLTVSLLLVNILLVSFILIRQKHGPPHKMPREIIIERLNFKGQQVDAYDNLIKWHRSEIEKTDEQIITLKKQIYQNLISTVNGGPDDSLITEVGR